MNCKPRAFAVFALVLVLLILAACGTQTATPPAPDFAMPLGTPVETISQATQAAIMTQEQSNADNQAAATAEIVRANAQGTLNSANATLNAARVQAQNNADVIAAQIAATAEIVRANAQATLSSAGATQSAALTQDAIRQTQVQFNLQMTVEQQNKEGIAAGTQTAVFNLIATQTQSALTISQFRDEQRQAPIAFLWMWCLPVFILLFGGLILWGFWRWLRIQQANQRIPKKPVDQLQPPATEVTYHQQDDSMPYLDRDVIDNRYQLTKPDDQVHRWVDEVKSKILGNDEKDEDDNADN